MKGLPWWSTGQDCAPKAGAWGLVLDLPSQVALEVIFLKGQRGELLSKREVKHRNMQQDSTSVS